jgi:multiple sugar transport system ATP-binding protein
VEATVAEVRYVQATKLYPGGDVPAVDRLDLEIADGELMVLVGPSGSGKTTALRMLAGLEEVDAGNVLIGGRDVTDVPAKKRDIAMVFQNYALYPYLTVAQNIAFPLKMAGVKKADREARAAEVARRLGLERFLDRKPSQLSGGERQRVAVARALANRPRLLLADEPTGALDSKSSQRVLDLLASIRERYGMTMLVVTYDPELGRLADRVVRMADGRVLA